MRRKLTNIICYRLDSKLKSKLLDKLNSEQVSLSSFHRDVVNLFIMDTRRTIDVLKSIEQQS